MLDPYFSTLTCVSVFGIRLVPPYTFLVFIILKKGRLCIVDHTVQRCPHTPTVFCDVNISETEIPVQNFVTFGSFCCPTFIFHSVQFQ